MTNSLVDAMHLPPFHSLHPSDLKKVVSEQIQENLKNIDLLLKENKQWGWDNLISIIDEWDDKLSQAWSILSHLNSVANTPECREAYQYCLPLLTDYSDKVGQNKKLYDAYRAIKESKEYNKLNQAQQKVIENALLDFQLAGVALSDEKKALFSKLNQELSELQNEFQNNVMDSTDAWFLTIENREQLAGLPEQTIALAKKTAERSNEKGWRLTLDYPCFSSVLMYADDRALRKKMHEAYFTRASEISFEGKWDNTENIERILKIRHEMANLLGYSNFAERSLAKKMANDPKEIMDFLVKLAERAKPLAQKEWEALQHFMKTEHGVDHCEPWDVVYYSEKWKQKNYAISQEALRAYFPLPVVMKGLFEVVKRIYGLRIEQNKTVETWHPDVQFFEIYDDISQLRGMFYLDLYARPQKRGGAWMDEARVRRRLANGELQYPIAYLTCNFRTPVEKNESSLLTHDEVLTLFHEFGHGLHHMLTKIDYPSVSGINGVPWDVVEVPSQFMENWCWQKEALHFLSSHYETNEPLSEEWLEKMQRAKNFQSAIALLRQIEFALFDFRIHLDYDPTQKDQWSDILKSVREKYNILPKAPYNRFAHGFSHIFSGGYAAGCYSYLWAEVLACDAFSKFKEEGIFNRATGNAFLEKVLEKGGSVDPLVWFKDFRGRAPSHDAFLHDHGL